ncbi:hypothetical protein D3C72_1995100 [compost metagenome]
MLCTLNCAQQRIEKPRQPPGDVQRTLLRTLQDVIVGLALALDLRGQAVEPLGTAVRPGQQQVADGPGDAAIAVIERMQRDEPQVR